MKRIISVILSFVFLFTLSGNVAYATNVDGNEFLTQQEMIANAPIDVIAISEAWSDMKSSGTLVANDDGLLYLDYDQSTRNTYKEYEYIVALLNEAISKDILALDPDTLQLETVTVLENSQIPYGVTHPAVRSNSSPRNAAHGCSITGLDLIALCEENYSTLSTFYWVTFALTLTNPAIDAWSTTVVFWVSKVAEGGDWDYKVQPGFSPWYTKFCSYFDGSYNHITSEYIGNFNYGYTGSFLFPLSILHFGSSAVSGFDPADEADWPAIDAGYYNATE